MKPIESVCICGAGYLGWQISLQCVSHRVTVKLYDISGEALKGASEQMRRELETRASEKMITPGGCRGHVKPYLFPRRHGRGRRGRRPSN